MPSITDNPPANVLAELTQLRNSLDQHIPQKSENNLLIATWNIRVFASLTRKWTSGEDDSPKRDLRGLRAIIEILSRFDVIALQEVKGDLRALRDTMRFLGEDWGFLMTDVNVGDRGHDERLAFLFNRNRLKPSGLAAEIVVPFDKKDEIPEGALNRQFARPPYAVSFKRNKITFILTTLHVLYGDGEEDRLPELEEIAEWMCEWAGRANKFDHNLLVLGDFNIDRAGSEGYRAFVSTGLVIPDQLSGLPRTIFDNPAQEGDKYYDQIAWFNEGEKALINMSVTNGGNFDFQPFLYQDLGLSKNSLSYRISDHLPLWVEFQLP